MKIRLSVAVILGLASCAASADLATGNEPTSFAAGDLLVADTRGKDRREDRGDDREGRQDCRKEEGRLGGDNRDCRQEERRGDDDDAAADDA